jgi:hypothetical protein
MIFLTGLDQRISGSAVDGAPTEEPRPDSNNARRQRPAPEGNSRVPCSCLCVKHPWFPTGGRCFTLPRPVIHPVRVHKFPLQASQCGMGSIPYRMCNVCTKKKLGVCWGLVDKISPAFELRVEKLGCVTRSWPCLVTGLRVGRQVGPAVKPEASTGIPASVSSRPDLTDSQSPAHPHL